MSRLDTLRTLKFANTDGALATAFITLTTGAFLVGLVKFLGGSDLWLGVLTAIPSMVGILQIPGAVWGRRFSSFKKFVTPGSWIWRLAYLPFVAIPLLPLPNDLRLLLVLACVTVAAVAANVNAPIYNDWLGEMVPGNSRGTFFSRRNAIAAAVGSIVGIIGGILLDTFKRNGQEDIGYAIVFALGWVIGLISMYFFLNMHDLQRTEVSQKGMAESIREFASPFKDRSFLRVLIYLALAIFGQSFAGNLFSAYAIETLDLGFSWLQFFAVLMAVGNVASARWWGTFSDKYGNRPVLMIAGFLVAFNPIMWLLCHPGEHFRNIVILSLFHIIVGVVWAGVAVTQFNLLLATAKPSERATYLGAGLGLQAVVSGIAPIIGALVMQNFRGHFDAEFAYKAVFVITIGFRMLGLVALIGVREAGSQPFKTAFWQLTKMSPAAMRAAKSFSTGNTVAERERAIIDLADQNFTFASDEIAMALHDPTPRIRRQAALALARLNPPNAQEELIHQFEDHPDLIEEETVEALGEIGDSGSLPTLAQTLRSPRSLLRRAAAKAIGRVGSRMGEPDLTTRYALEALMSAATDEHDVDLRRSALQSLRHWGSPEAYNVIAEATLDPYPSVRIAAAEAIEELGIEIAAPALRESISRYRDEATAEVAYALGAVGQLSDLKVILEIASNSVSVIPRRRALLGVSRLLKIESLVYQLMRKEGMAQDGVLVNMLSPLSKRSKRVQVALERYSEGNESAAVMALASALPSETMNELGSANCEEIFLIAAAYAVKSAP